MALAPDLHYLFVVFLTTSLAAGVTTTVLLLTRSAPELRPRWRYVDRGITLQLAREGVQFFLLNVIGIVSFRADAFLVGHYLGAASVPAYLLPLNIFALIPTFTMMFLTPLWPAYREAWARGDGAWVRSAYVRSVAFVTTASVLASGALVVVAPSILRMWLGVKAVSPSTGQLAALACYAVLMSTSSAVGVFLNGLGALRPQLCFASVMAVVNLGASIWSLRHIGLSGPLWATVVTQTLLGLAPCMIYVRRRLSVS
ncbi:lipopolysaccharide biosynthesis protein [Streptomyces chiangmaiensis]